MGNSSLENLVELAKNGVPKAGPHFSIVSYEKTVLFLYPLTGNHIPCMKAVLNIQRIGFNALKAHARHERREIGDLTHTDATKTPLNASIGLDKCPEAAVKKYLDQAGAKIDKRNETPITRVLLSASPEYFRPGRADQSGEYDQNRLNPWLRESVKWIKKEFGDDAVHIATHLDETTVHLHVLVVPTYDKITKRRTVKQVSHHKHPAFAGLNSYEDLHDRYAEGPHLRHLLRIRR